MDEYTKLINGQDHKAYVANIFPKIAHTDLLGKSQDTIFISKLQAKVRLDLATCKDIYEELLKKNYIEHHSEEKWENKFSEYGIEWDKIWESVNNPVTSENVKTTVWEQIHLNDFCTYSYNKWHTAQDKCPFCLVIPTSKFHLTLDCEITKTLWKDLEHHPTKMVDAPITEQKLFCLLVNTPNIILRNWLNFNLHGCVVEQEGPTFHNRKGQANLIDIKIV